MTDLPEKFFKFKSSPNTGYTWCNVNVGDTVTFGDSEKYIVTNILKSVFEQDAIVFMYNTKENFFKKINEAHDKESS